MKRRNFLRIGSAAGIAVALVNHLPVRVFASNPLLSLLKNQSQQNGRVIVVIQLNGGNDGLNTLIPLDQYPALSAARSNILIPQNKVLGMDGTLLTGLHPSMTGIRTMFNSGIVNIIQGVSYPNPNFSHFRATDIWLTASDANQYLDSGWLGRYLSADYPGFPTGYPNATNPDPPAIQIGTGVSTALQGPQVSMGMAITDISTFYNIINGTVDPSPSTPAGHELTFLRYIAQQTQQYNTAIRNAAQQATNLSSLYPSNNSLSDQLKIVARLIAGGLETPVYFVNLGGFDTHSAQVDVTDHTAGTHANLLNKLSEAVFAFFDDCRLLSIDKKVAAMTFSEFGRRIISNGSNGTDHGTAEPVFVFSPGVNPGILGNNPVIPANATASNNLPMEYDFRSVYAAVLADWFGIAPAELNTILLQDFPVLPVFNKTWGINPVAQTSGNGMLQQNYPNPFSDTTTIVFTTPGGMTTLELSDLSGQPVRELVKQAYPAGTFHLTVAREGLPAGTYIYSIRSGSARASMKLVVVD